jgi:hypothetical protein
MMRVMMVIMVMITNNVSNFFTCDLLSSAAVDSSTETEIHLQGAVYSSAGAVDSSTWAVDY